VEEGAAAVAAPSKQTVDEAKVLSKLSSADEGAGLDSGAAAAAMKAITLTDPVDEASIARARAMAAVVVNKADVDVIAAYFQLTVAEAEVQIRTHGDLPATLKALAA